MTILRVLTRSGLSSRCRDINSVPVPVRLVVKRRAGLEDWPVHLCQEFVSEYGKAEECLECTGSDDAGLSATLRDGDQC